MNGKFEILAQEVNPISQTSTKKEISLGILGAGLFASERHLPAIKDLVTRKLIVVKAIYSRSKESADKLLSLFPKDQQEKITIYWGGDDHVESLLKRQDIDAIDIVLPIAIQPKYIEMAWKFNKHVISEKPIAPSMTQAEELLKKYEKQLKENPQLVWAVGENFCCTPAILQASELVHSGQLGKILTCHLDVKGSVSKDNKYFNTSWRKDPEYQGGFLLDGGVHFVAMLRLVVGDIVSIASHSSQFKDYLPPADTLSASLLFKNGALGTLLMSFAYTKGAPPLLTVNGDKGSLRVSRAEMELTEIVGEKGELKVHPKFEDSDFETGPVISEFEIFRDCIEFGMEETVHYQRISPLQAMGDLQLIEALLLAPSRAVPLSMPLSRSRTTSLSSSNYSASHFPSY